MLQNFAKYAPAFIVIILAFYMINYYDYNCAREKSMKKRVLNGIVTAKYLDSTQHNFPRINFTTFTGKLGYEYIINEHNNIYDQISVGDTIVKNQNSLKIVIKKGVYVINTEFNYACKD